MGGENRRAKSLRNGVHHANAVVWGPVRGRRTRLTAASTASVAVLICDVARSRVSLSRASAALVAASLASSAARSSASSADVADDVASDAARSSARSADAANDAATFSDSSFAFSDSSASSRLVSRRAAPRSVIVAASLIFAPSSSRRASSHDAQVKALFAAAPSRASSSSRRVAERSASDALQGRREALKGVRGGVERRHRGGD